MTIGPEDLPMLLALLDSFYLRRSGTNTLKDNLNFLNEIDIQRQGTSYIESTSAYLRLLKNLWCTAQANFASYFMLTNTGTQGIFYTKGNPTSFKHSYDGGTNWDTWMQIIRGGAVGLSYAQIEKCGHIKPVTQDLWDLGASGKEFRNAYVGRQGSLGRVLYPIIRFYSAATGSLPAASKWDMCGDSTLNKLVWYNGSAWETITSV